MLNKNISSKDGCMQCGGKVYSSGLCKNCYQKWVKDLEEEIEKGKSK